VGLSQSPYMAGANRYPEPDVSGWTGWIVFASIMLGMAGVFQGIAGFVALFKDDYWLVAKNDLAVSVSYTTWGWTHLIMGALLLFAAFSLMRGHMFGRIIGVVAAVLSAIVNLAFLSASPAWSLIVITFDVLVIWSITVHGRELRAD
jgi:hypothetical protein